MNWLKKHVDTTIIMSGILCSFLWMNSQLKDIDKRFNKIEQDLAVIKAVLLMKNIMPAELACKTIKEEKE